MHLPPEWCVRLEDVLGSAPIRFEPAQQGFTPALRGVVTTEAGERVFLKAATDVATSRWLQAEWRIYGEVRSPHVPRCLHYEAGPRPWMLLEDLSGCTAPPPWQLDQVEAVEQALSAIARLPIPTDVPVLTRGNTFNGWSKVAAAPERFMALGWREPTWCDAVLPKLVAAEAHCSMSGDALLHMDVRSDNLRLRGEIAVLFDWNWARRGNAKLDRAFWLPSLHMEGGPAPRTRLIDAPAAACVAGFFCWEGSQPADGLPDGLRAFQQAQGRIALDWAEYCLGR